MIGPRPQRRAGRLASAWLAGTALSVFLGALPLAASANPGEGESPKPESDAGAGATVSESAPITPAGAGWRVFVDPRTGEILSPPPAARERAFSEKLATEQPDLSYSSLGLRPFRLSDGSLGVDLEGRFVTATILHLHPGGGATLTCSDAAVPLAPPPPAAAPYPVEER